MVYIIQSSNANNNPKSTDELHENNFKPIHESYENDFKPIDESNEDNFEPIHKSYENDFKPTNESNKDNFEPIHENQINELREVDKRLNSASSKSPSLSCKNSEASHREITYEKSQAGSIMESQAEITIPKKESKEPEPRTRSMDPYEKQPRQSRFSTNKLDTSTFRKDNYQNIAHWSMSIRDDLNKLNFLTWLKPTLKSKDKQPEKTQAEYEKELNLIKSHNIYPSIQDILKHYDKIKKSTKMTLDAALFKNTYLQVLFKELYQLYEKILYQKINLTTNENINTFATKAHEFMDNIYILDDKNLITRYEIVKIRIHAVLLKKTSEESILKFNEIIYKISTNKNIKKSKLNKEDIDSSLAEYKKNQLQWKKDSIFTDNQNQINFKYMILHVLFQIITNDINSNNNTWIYELYMPIDKIIPENQYISDEFKLAQKYYNYINEPTEEMLLKIFGHIFPDTIKEYEEFSHKSLRIQFESYLLKQNKITNNDIENIKNNVDKKLVYIELCYDYLLRQKLITMHELTKIRESYLFLQTMHVIFNAKAQYIQEILKNETSSAYNEFKQENSRLTEMHILHTMPNNLNEFNFDQIIEHPFIYHKELSENIQEFIKTLKDILKTLNKTRCI